MTLTGLVRLDRPIEPDDRLSVLPMVSVLDALGWEDLASAMLCAPSFPGVEVISKYSLDELMSLVVEGLSRFAIDEIKYGRFSAEAERALTCEERGDLHAATKWLSAAAPPVAGQRPVFGMPVESEVAPTPAPGSRRHLRAVA